MIEPEVMKKAIGGDRRCQEQLYRESYGFLFPVTCRYFRNEEDRVTAINKSFMKILNALEAFLGENAADRYEFWARRIVINVCLDELRKTSRINDVERSTDFGEEEYKVDTVSLNDAEQTMTDEELENMLCDLPEQQRVVFNLYAIEGYSHSEIAEILKITEENSRYRLSKARKTLQSFVKKLMALKSILL